MTFLTDMRGDLLSVFGISKAEGRGKLLVPVSICPDGSYVMVMEEIRLNTKTRQQ